MGNEKKKVLLIVNPCAGRTKLRPSVEQILEKFSQDDYEFTVQTTTCRGDATSIVKNNGEGMDFVISCGGDGTLNETINGVMDMLHRIPIGYVPIGSTNDLATTLGIPTDIKKAAAVIEAGNTNSYDIGLFNNRYFSYIAAFGAATRASYATSQKMKNRFGHVAYIFSGFKEWKNMKPVHMRVEYDGGVIEDDFSFGAVSNSTSVAGVFKFNVNDVKLNDGLFEILLVRRIRPITAPAMLGKVIRHEYDGKHIVFLRTSKARFISNEEVPWTLDGEYGGAPKTAIIHVLSKAVELCSPENPLFEKDAVSGENPVISALD